MDKRRAIVFLFALVCCLLLPSVPLAGTSPEGYTIDWQVIAGGGGLAASGGGYTLDSTVGQTAIGWSAGSHQLGSGFWYGTGMEYMVYLPLTLKS